ncbi:putative hydroxymethylglutaryl-CoA lyase, mitochondrial precursor, partial [Toxoplasma gondii p89]
MYHTLANCLPICQAKNGVQLRLSVADLSSRQLATGAAQRLATVHDTKHRLEIPKVRLVEVSPRDGLQNEEKVLSLDDKITFINMLE